jgi:hypothetical protein
MPAEKFSVVFLTEVESGSAFSTAAICDSDENTFCAEESIVAVGPNEPAKLYADTIRPRLALAKKRVVVFKKVFFIYLSLLRSKNTVVFMY